MNNTRTIYGITFQYYNTIAFPKNFSQAGGLCNALRKAFPNCCFEQHLSEDNPNVCEVGCTSHLSEPQVKEMNLFAMGYTAGWKR